ncbi:hypothetical protein CPB97_003917 [Podila verticillata]|nr:hypothetical protein CPB97_003917 [Podila verticillata]
MLTWETSRSVTTPPSKSNLSTSRERPVIQGLCSVTGHPTPKRGTMWKELFELAECYQVFKLREFYHAEIVTSFDKSNAANILFEFAYRHIDLKEQVLSFLSNSVEDFDSGDRDSFTAYKDHSEGYLLLIGMLKRSKLHAHQGLAQL